MRVLDDDGRPLPRARRSEVEPLPVHVSPHRLVIGIRIRSVTLGHAPCGLAEGNIEEHRVIPGVDEAVPVQEQPLDDYERVIRRLEELPALNRDGCLW